MSFYLSQSDVRLLHDCIEQRLNALQQELVHTEFRQLQHDLRADIAQLERLRSLIDEQGALLKLQSEATTAPQRPD